MVNYIFLVILIVVRALTGLRLFISGRKNNLPNLIWLSGSMFVTVIILLFAAVEGNPLAYLPFSLLIFTVGSIIGQACLIIFNQLTFYKDRKSPAGWIWTIFIILSALAIYGVTISESNFKQSPLVAASAPAAALIWAWHGWLAYQGLRQIASEESVQNWVKARYRLIIAYSVVLTIGAIASIIRNFFAVGGLQSSLGSLMATISLVSQIVSITLLFLVWVMPEPFRLWLNREQRTPANAEHPISVLDVFGTAMTDNTGLKSMACFYALRATVAKNIGSEDSAVVRAQIDTMSYNDWDTVLKHPELRRILINSGADTESSKKAIENAQKALVDKQSLLTIRAH